MKLLGSRLMKKYRQKAFSFQYCRKKSVPTRNSQSFICICKLDNISKICMQLLFGFCCTTFGSPSSPPLYSRFMHLQEYTRSDRYYQLLDLWLYFYVWLNTVIANTKYRYTYSSLFSSLSKSVIDITWV